MPFTAIRIPIGAAEDTAATDAAERVVATLEQTQIDTQSQAIETSVAVVGAFESESQALAVAQRAIAILALPVYLVDPDSGDEQLAEPAPVTTDASTPADGE